MKPTGLLNCGNTCYANALLQCLFNMEIFNNTRMQHNLDDAFVEEFYKLHDKVRSGTCGSSGGGAVSPREFLYELRKEIKCIEVFESNDIRELYDLMIDKLNTKFMTKIQITSTDKHLTKWKESVKDDYSWLKDTMYGQCISQLKCGNCNKILQNYEVFGSLLLPIPNGASTLDECFDSYFAAQNHEMVCDEGCKQNIVMRNAIRVSRLPKCIVVCLKRFHDNGSKNNTHIDIPEILDLSRHCMNYVGKCRYKLTGIACHGGDIFGGHYWALCKDPNGTWYHIDDNFVLIEPRFRVPDTAYMLFYTRAE